MWRQDLTLRMDPIISAESHDVGKDMKSKCCRAASRFQLSLRCVEQECYLEHCFINIVTNEHSCALQQIVLCQCITHKSILHGVTGKVQLLQIRICLLLLQ